MKKKISKLAEGGTKVIRYTFLSNHNNHKSPKTKKKFIYRKGIQEAAQAILKDYGLSMVWYGQSGIIGLRNDIQGNFYNTYHD